MAHYKNFTNPGSSKRIKSSVEFEFQMQETDFKKNLEGMIFIQKKKIPINCVGTIFSVPTT